MGEGVVGWGGERNIERERWLHEYQGNVEATGEDYSVEPAESRRPFRALLDVGLLRTTTGNRVFGALKGALDGGLDIPHSDKRFAGFSKDSKKLDAEVHRKYIYGGHVSAYMATLMEDEPEKYQSHFWWCGGCAQLTKSTTSPYIVLSRSTDESCMRTRALTGKSGQLS
ncbi:60S ribosomal protein L5-like [Camellia sinensis]|uniref:60S ribosomal protein L5-like n=1 Tax=Camellia sinensis TaxID=4442 RepID=UPI00103594A0|nr:60S ribosomal protein L5-like [Camellia sinensis]